jgi:periplasmic divalent cation tolerance protein
MKAKKNFVMVLVTAPNRQTARALARAALRARLVACANLIGPIESIYWWKDRIETGRETLIFFKTTAVRLRALEKLIVDGHPYDTPEFVVLPLIKGNERYLAWLQQAVSSPPHR